MKYMKMAFKSCRSELEKEVDRFMVYFKIHTNKYC